MTTTTTFLLSLDGTELARCTGGAGTSFANRVHETAKRDMTTGAELGGMVGMPAGGIAGVALGIGGGSPVAALGLGTMGLYAGGLVGGLVGGAAGYGVGVVHGLGREVGVWK